MKGQHGVLSLPHLGDDLLDYVPVHVREAAVADRMQARRGKAGGHVKSSSFLVTYSQGFVPKYH
ncbi:MAG: hypothetical protein EBU04_08920 [Verrucomicrobia bacterium]|nr:hypothetical protein [Verrucomicrobiota bacterium]NBS05507.1 hypothetical protein [Verrucomicrobiota bacterium]NBY36004.1 hypothetical protein [Verrucomicrobiota bacterium]